MDGANYDTEARTGLPDYSRHDANLKIISIDQLQRLVQLFDKSDVSELELKRPEEGTHLVLRKAKAPESIGHTIEQQYVSIPGTPPEKIDSVKTEHKILAPLVGTFHTWAKPKGGALVAVGDSVKAGQLVGTIESLNVLNEVETTAAGHVMEILVQEGQPVEYGQVLMSIDIHSRE
jgi:acetyl-CoA carboxylase biotin carboxyl carrier protein